MYAAINYQNVTPEVVWFTEEPKAAEWLKTRAEDVLGDGERPRNLDDWCVAEVIQEITVVDIPFENSIVVVTPVKDGTRAALEREVAELRALLSRIAQLHVSDRSEKEDRDGYAEAFGKAVGMALTAGHIATHVRKPDAKEQKQAPFEVVTSGHVARSCVPFFGAGWRAQLAFGRVLANEDVGKRVYLRNSVPQLESDDEYAARRVAETQEETRTVMAEVAR